MSDLDFNDIAAMLQAVAAEENVGKDKTRAAPAFHSLTADDSPRITSPRISDVQTALSDESRFLYGSDTHSDNQDDDSAGPRKRRRLGSDEHELPPPSGMRSDFSDISDILNHLVHFEHPHHVPLSTEHDAREADDVVEQVIQSSPGANSPILGSIQHISTTARHPDQQQQKQHPSVPTVPAPQGGDSSVTAFHNARASDFSAHLDLQRTYFRPRDQSNLQMQRVQTARSSHTHAMSAESGSRGVVIYSGTCAYTPVNDRLYVFEKVAERHSSRYSLAFSVYCCTAD
jgi:hypothetical protein